MKKHSEKVTVDFSSKQMYDMVLDIEKYPEFVPWCSGCRILEKIDDKNWLAQMDIGFAGFKESFKSNVSFCAESEKIDVKLIEGPFKKLQNKWSFSKVSDKKCEIDFYIEFKFKNIILEKLVGGLFDKSAKHMVEAFIERAEEVYA